MSVEWKVIEGWPNYMISTEGDILDITKNKILKPSQGKDVQVSLYRVVDGVREHKTMHPGCLVLLTFVGPRPRKLYCLHKDKNRRNNNLDNLMWATMKDCAEKSYDL